MGSKSSRPTAAQPVLIHSGPPLNDPNAALPGWTEIIVIHIAKMRVLQVWLVKQEGHRIVLDGRLVKRTRTNKHIVAPGNLFPFDGEIKDVPPTEWLYLHTKRDCGGEWNTMAGAGRSGCRGYTQQVYVGPAGPAIMPVVAMLVRGRQVVGRIVYERDGDVNKPVMRHWVGDGEWSEERAPEDTIDFEKAFGNVEQSVKVEVYKSGPRGPIDELANWLREGGYDGRWMSVLKPYRRNSMSDR